MCSGLFVEDYDNMLFLPKIKWYQRVLLFVTGLVIFPIRFIQVKICDWRLKRNLKNISYIHNDNSKD